MGDADLFDVYTKVVKQLTDTMRRFVAWWDNATIDWRNIQGHMIVLNRKSQVNYLIVEWRDLQFRYQLYREEVSLMSRARKPMTYCTADYGAPGLLYFEVLTLEPWSPFATANCSNDDYIIFL